MASLFSFSLQSSKLAPFLNICFIFLLSFYAAASYSSNNHTILNYNVLIANESTGSDSCTGLKNFTDYKSKCSFVKSQRACKPQGYIDYLEIFYCTCGKFPILGLIVLTIWLFVLFYLLGDTAANYFCPSLESLSKILKLPPTIAGVTLLSLGNGASDVFSSIVSFTGSQDGDLGLNSVMGGAFFVSSFVVGTICVLIGPKEVSIDKHSFVRDIIFFLVSLAFLFLIVFIGKITLWFALSYVSLYLLYVGVVSASHFFHLKKPNSSLILRSSDDLAEMGIPLLGYINDEKPISNKETNQEEESKIFNLDSLKKYRFLSVFFRILDLPLYLPRRLTIPVVREDRWSKPYAVISITLAPVLLAILSKSQNTGSERSLVLYIAAGFIGLILGSIALFSTEWSNPPKKWLLPWLVAGFVMSVTWTYIIAEELVSLLVAIGIVFEIRPSVLGVTVLAWGNSVGDLIANATMAMNGGKDGAQIALSGCYAGPIFNTVIGIGVPLVMSSLEEYPGVYLIPRDSSFYETLGFLMGGLLLALVILPSKNMKLDRLAGGGLLAIYLCFLFLRLARTFGILSTTTN